jgi:hypothetical protein
MKLIVSFIRLKWMISNASIADQVRLQDPGFMKGNLFLIQHLVFVILGIVIVIA